MRVQLRRDDQGRGDTGAGAEADQASGDPVSQLTGTSGTAGRGTAEECVDGTAMRRTGQWEAVPSAVEGVDWDAALLLSVLRGPHWLACER